MSSAPVAESVAVAIPNEGTSLLKGGKPKRRKSLAERHPKGLMLFMSFCIAVSVTAWQIHNKPVSKSETSPVETTTPRPGVCLCEKGG